MVVEVVVKTEQISEITFSKIYYWKGTCTLQLLFAQNYWAEINFPCPLEEKKRGGGKFVFCQVPVRAWHLNRQRQRSFLSSRSLSFSLFILPPLLFSTSAKSQSVSFSPALESWPAAQEWRRHLSWPSKHTDAVAAAAVKSCRERLQRWI